MKENETLMDCIESCIISIAMTGFMAAGMIAALGLLWGSDIGSQGSLTFLVLVVIFSGLSSGLTQKRRLRLLPKKTCVGVAVATLLLYLRWGSNLARGMTSETVFGCRIATVIIWIIQTLLLNEIMLQSSEIVAKSKERKRQLREEQSRRNNTPEN